MYEGIRIQNGTQTVELNSLPKSENGELILTGIETLKVYLSNGASYLDANLEILENNDDVKIAFIDSNGDEVVIILRGLNVMLLTNSEEIPLLEVIDGNNSLISLRTIEDLDAAAAGATASSDVATADELEGDNLDLSTTFDGPSNPEGFGGLGEPIVVEPAAAEIITFSGDISATITEDTGQNQDGVFSGTISNSAGLAFVPNTLTTSYGIFTINSTGSWTYDLDETLTNVQGLLDGESIIDNIVVSLVDGTSSFTIGVTIAGLNDKPEIENIFIGAYNDEINEGDLSFETSSKIDLEGVDDTSSEANNQYTGVINISDADISNTHNLSIISGSENIVDYNNSGVTLDDISISLVFNESTNEWEYNIEGDFSKLAVGESLTLSFDYQADDLRGFSGELENDDTSNENSLSDIKTITLSVFGTNDKPVITDITSSSQIDETNTALTTNGLISVSDVDTTDEVTMHVNSVTISGTSDTKPTNAEALSMFSFSSNQILDNTQTSNSVNWEFNSGSENFDYLSEGETIVLEYVVSAVDNNLISSTNSINESSTSETKTVTVTITGTNDVVELASTVVSGDVVEDASDPVLSDSGDIAFTDVDLSDGHTVSVGNASVGALGVLTASITEGNDGDGAGVVSWEYTVSNAAVQYLSAGETKEESFDITIDDGNGSTDTKTVTVTITGTNDVVELASTVVSGDVVEDASDPVLSDSGDIAFTDVDLSDGHTVSVGNASVGALGVLTASITEGNDGDGAGVVSWEYTVSNAAVQYLSAGETKEESFDITIDDGNGSTDTKTVTVTITGTNDVVELASTVVSGDVVEDASDPVLSDSGDIAFTDVDLSDGHTVSVGNASVGALGVLTASITEGNDGDGAGVVSWEYTVSNAAVQYLSAGETKEESFDITIDDGNGSTDTKTVTVTITGTNDVVELASTVVSGDVVEDASDPVLSDSGDIAFTDVDLSDGHTVSVGNASVGALGVLTASITEGNDGDGAGVVSWEYTVSNAAVQYLSAGETKEESFDITIDDGNGSTDTKTVTVTITGTNDVVELASTVVSGDVVEDASDPVLSDSGDIAFTDVDLSDGHTVSVGNASVGALGVLTASITEGNDGDGAGVVSWEYTVSNAAVQYLSAGETKEESFDITIDDGNGSTDTKTVTVTITGTNDVVELASTVVSGDVVEDASDPVLSDSGDIAFTDVDLSDGHTVSVGNASVGALGVLTASITEGNDGDGAGVVSWEYTVSNAAVQYLSAGETKEESFDITIDDGNGSTDTKTVTVTITGTNDAPIITGGPDTSDLLETDLGLTADGELTVSDVDILDLVSASVDSVSIGGTATSKPTNQDVIGMLSLSPLAILDNTETTDTLSWSFDSGNEAFDYLEEGETLILEYTVKAVDDHGAFDTETVTITITGTSDNEPPELQADTFDIVEDSAVGAYVGTVDATDVDGDSLTFTLLNNTDKFAIDNSGNITYIGNESNKLDYETTTEYTLDIQVSDGELTDVQSYTVNILDIDEEVTGGGTVIETDSNFDVSSDVIKHDDYQHIESTTLISPLTIEAGETYTFIVEYADPGVNNPVIGIIFDSNDTQNIIYESAPHTGASDDSDLFISFDYTNNTGSTQTIDSIAIASDNNGISFTSYTLTYPNTSDQVLTLAEVDTDGDHIDFVRLLDDASNDLTSNAVPTSLDLINMNSGDHILSNINVEDILAITDEDNTLKIVGDNGDSINLDLGNQTDYDNGTPINEKWYVDSTQSTASETAYVSTNGSDVVTLLIENDVNVI